MTVNSDKFIEDEHFDADYEGDDKGTRRRRRKKRGVESTLEWSVDG